MRWFQRSGCSLVMLALCLTPVMPQSPPRLVVVIVLDQFPYEYLTRFRQHFGPGGFLRMMNNGASFTNVVYAHANTSTGPGHAVLSTGAYGCLNGIVGNSWYENRAQRARYCVADTTTTLLGTRGQGRSPANLQMLTFGDRLRIATGFQGKVFSLSNKDRAAILMGGKYATMAIWMRDSAFVSSSYYAKELPQWLRTFNSSGLVNSYFGRRWERSLPLSAFHTLDRDDAPYEEAGNGMGTTFPHRITGTDTTRITSSYYSALLTSPFGSEALAALARQAVRGEKLGRRGVTDLLSISFSGTDYVGHSYGPHSWETLEMVVQTDRILAGFFEFLDKEVGLAHCLIALSSDHAISPAPGYLAAASGHDLITRVSVSGVLAACESTLTASYGAPAGGTKWVAAVYNNSITFSPTVLIERNAEAGKVATMIARKLQEYSAVAAVFTREEIEHLVPFTSLERRMKNSYLRSRSGDVIFAAKPLYIDAGEGTGASHGQPYESDAHVPLLLMGPGITKGIFWGEATPADLAPTLSALTGVEFTPGRQGRVLAEALRGK
jgi:predicted AlkP superfamily pyrophosphatase or phosphodiesterase